MLTRAGVRHGQLAEAGGGRPAMSLSMPHRGSSEKSRSRLRLCPCRSRSRPAFGAELRPPVRWRAVGSLRLLIGGRTASGAAWQNAYGEDPYSVARRRRYLHTATSPTESASHNRNLHFCAPRPYAAFIEPPDPRAGAAPHVEDLALVIDSAPEIRPLAGNAHTISSRCQRSLGHGDAGAAVARSRDRTSAPR